MPLVPNYQTKRVKKDTGGAVSFYLPSNPVTVNGDISGNTYKRYVGNGKYVTVPLEAPTTGEYANGTPVLIGNTWYVRNYTGDSSGTSSPDTSSNSNKMMNYWKPTDSTTSSTANTSTSSGNSTKANPNVKLSANGIVGSIPLSDMVGSTTTNPNVGYIPLSEMGGGASVPSGSSTSGAAKGGTITKGIAPPAKYHGGGLFASDGAGRSDILERDVDSGSYVVPADVVSALGDGNTLNGSKTLDGMMGGVQTTSPIMMNKGGSVPVITAGGEYLIPRSKIIAKFGDLDKGHKILDAFVKKVREQNIQKLRRLPNPRKD